MADRIPQQALATEHDETTEQPAGDPQQDGRPDDAVGGFDPVVEKRREEPAVQIVLGGGVSGRWPDRYGEGAVSRPSPATYDA